MVTVNTNIHNGNQIGIIEIEPTNILMKDEDYKIQIMENFKKLVNSINTSIQILCSSDNFSSNKFSIEGYDEYNTLINNKINNVVKKKFKIIVNNDDESILRNNLKTIKRHLKSCSIQCSDYKITTYDNICSDELNVDYMQINDQYVKTFYVTDYPHSCSFGWLKDIYNSELNVDISFFIHPVSKSDAEEYLTKKLNQNTSNSSLEDEKDVVNDKYDERINSAIKMRKQLRKNKCKFFFTSFYITLKADNINQLNRESEYLRTLMSGLNVNIKNSYLRQEDAYKCTRAFGRDVLEKYYNLTTKQLGCFFPFTNSNIIDKKGILVGDNIVNSSLVFLDPFKYDSYLMFIIGKVGGGKSYLSKLLCLRLLQKGVKIDIFDKEGEYLQLKELTNSPNLRVHNYNNYSDYLPMLERYVYDMDNNNELQKRMLFIDEFWQFVDNTNKEFLEYVKYITLTSRKKHQALCAISQEIEHLLETPETYTIIKQASIKALMKSEPSEARMIKEELNLTESEVNFLISADNEGLLLADNKQVQFKALSTDKEDKIITTDPSQILQLREEGKRGII
jgi:hypothetical protein